MHIIEAEAYTMKEICEKYKVTRKVAMRRIEHFDIPKIYEGRNVSFSKTAVDRYFAQLIEDFNKEDYYTVLYLIKAFLFAGIVYFFIR